MGTLRQFTCAPRRVDPCPHGCASWARYVGPDGDPVAGPDGHKHNTNCPVIHAARRAAALEACRDTSYTPPPAQRPETGRDTVSPARCGTCSDYFDYAGGPQLCPRCKRR